jgi:hypothetical protein
MKDEERRQDGKGCDYSEVAWSVTHPTVGRACSNKCRTVVNISDTYLLTIVCFLA